MAATTLTLFPEPLSAFGPYTFMDLPPGWRFKSTPGHGYLYPNSIAQNKVPEFLRCHYPYEEDCAYVIPIVCNSELFTEETITRALQTFRDYYPEAFEIVFATSLQRGQSYLNDMRLDRLDNLGRYEKTSGCGDWRYGVPTGFVLATARLVTEKDCKNFSIHRATGEEVEGIMDQDKYQSNTFFDKTDFLPIEKGFDISQYLTWEEYTEKTGKSRSI